MVDWVVELKDRNLLFYLKKYLLLTFQVTSKAIEFSRVYFEIAR